MRVHELKTDPKVFEATFYNQKPWEIRLNDRNYQKYDYLMLRETRYSGTEMKEQNMPLVYTGRAVLQSIKWILEGPMYGLQDGWVIMTVEELQRLTGYSGEEEEAK